MTLEEIARAWQLREHPYFHGGHCSEITLVPDYGAVVEPLPVRRKCHSNGVVSWSWGRSEKHIVAINNYHPFHNSRIWNTNNAKGTLLGFSIDTCFERAEPYANLKRDIGMNRVHDGCMFTFTLPLAWREDDRLSPSGAGMTPGTGELEFDCVAWYASGFVSDPEEVVYLLFGGDVRLCVTRALTLSILAGAIPKQLATYDLSEDLITFALGGLKTVAATAPRWLYHKCRRIPRPFPDTLRAELELQHQQALSSFASMAVNTL
jgi:hypothetical protein